MSETAGLIEELRKWAIITACEDPFLDGAEDAHKTLYGRAADALAQARGGEEQGSSRASSESAACSGPITEAVRTDPKTWWFLENAEARWLENAEHGTFTSDPNAALKWPNSVAADTIRRGLRGPLWALRATEHMWIEPSPRDWSEFEDEIADAISDSIDMDWSSRDGARAVVQLLNRISPHD